MVEKLPILLLISAVALATGQDTPYSLQAAVDALHRREAQLASRDNFVAPPRYLGPDDEYWGDGGNEVPTSPQVNRHQLNRILAKYLARDNERARGGNIGYETDFDDENYDPDERKRSFFRERDGKYDAAYPTVFRERELEPYSQPELAEEFLHEIERERELEREEKYKQMLRHLWDKYQQDENDIEQELFDDEKKKRQSTHEVAPFYVGPVMEKKRTLPLLPWLPATRRKRFPVTKRSPKIQIDNVGASGTDEKVARDLQALFGHPVEEKKKRSSGNEPPGSESPALDSKKSEKKSSEHDHSSHSHAHNNEHDEEEEERSDEHGEERSDEHDHEHAHEHDEEEDEDHDFDDEDDEDRKKKREVKNKKRSTQEVIKEDQIIPGDLNDYRKKKSIQWSKYFGMDRRKKSAGWYMADNRGSRNEEKKKILAESNEDDMQKKKDTDPDKLDSMDRKLKTIEDLIIGETVKYTGAHEGTSDPEEIRRLKDHVVSRLATAYSLEKMRRSLDKLRQSVDNEKILDHNDIETEKKEAQKEKEKRVAVKKEKVEYDNNHHAIDTPSVEKSHEVQANGIDENEDEKKKKKKRNGFGRYAANSNDLSDFEEELGAGHFEPLNDAFLDSKSYSLRPNQCPLLNSMEERCRGVDILSGDVHQDLLPICEVHQLCYLCGTSQTACDFQYLSEADSLCGQNTECQSAARSGLMILRGSPGPQLGPKECLKNPCLYRSMREIGL